MWNKAGGKGTFAPQTLNTVGGDNSHWQNNSIMWRASGNSVPYICGGWFKVWGDEGQGADYSQPIPIATQDFDSGSAVGYARIRFYFNNLGNDNPEMRWESYRAGGQRAGHFRPGTGVKDPGQWFHLVGYLISGTEFGFIINGKDAGTVDYDRQDGPYPNSTQSLITAVFTHRFAGAWHRDSSASMWIYEYFMMNMPDYINNPEWQARGVDPNNKDTWSNPWIRNAGGIYIDPITNADDTGRQELISRTSRGISGTIDQDRNDWSAVWNSNTFTSVNFPDGAATGAYLRQPVYGYDLREYN